MSGVVIYLPRGSGEAAGEPCGDAVTLRLGPGEVARFGRGSATTPVELRLDDEAISRLAGEIRVTDDHWQLSNLSTTQSYLVENPEGAGEYLRVPPRRAGAPIPFEFSRVVLPARRNTSVAFQVFAPDHVYLDPDGLGGQWGSRTAHGVLPGRDGPLLPHPRRRSANRGCATSRPSRCRPRPRSWNGSRDTPRAPGSRPGRSARTSTTSPTRRCGSHTGRVRAPQGGPPQRQTGGDRRARAAVRSGTGGTPRAAAAEGRGGRREGAAR